MAALPSVVLGFIAGLWLAPMLERIVPGVLLMPVVITVLAVLGAAAWAKLPSSVRVRIPNGWEAVLLVPLVVGGGALSIWLGFQVERFFLASDYRHFLLTALGLTYDQRNSLVVGIAMGFAVIPIIFTVAEDSLSSVPTGLAAGSLALGATRWQTALRTVLPTASPGIFSAVMIGFGRAVGETMIVLMATGNTPVMDIVDLQRLPRPLGEHRRRAARGPGRRDALPRPLPGGPPPLPDDVRREHGGRAGAAAPPEEVQDVRMSSATPRLASARKAGLFRSGEPFIWITGSGLAAAVLMVAGLLWLILANGLGFFWPADVSQYTLNDGRTVAGPLAARETGPGSGRGRRDAVPLADQGEAGEPGRHRRGLRLDRRVRDPVDARGPPTSSPSSGASGAPSTAG